MEFICTDMTDVLLIRPRRFGDARGYFSEVWKQELFESHVPGVRFIQDNESLSTAGVLRGLHYQRGDASQAKLVRVSRGAVLDVAVDLRLSSPTFGRYIATELSAENGLQMYIPRGFAHGFLVLSDVAQFQYKVDTPYAPEAEVTLLYDDPEIAVPWSDYGLVSNLSPKDRAGMSLVALRDAGLLFP